MDEYEERTLSVIAPEQENGNTEYKRQLRAPTASRLRSLATQMSYRLDEGMGRCTYQIGVEDDGCHSLLDYASVSESARILECIARSLNAVVLERLMIQGEVVQGTNGSSDKLILSTNKDDLVVVEEPSILGNGRDSLNEEDRGLSSTLSAAQEDEKEEKTEDATIRVGKRPLVKEGTGPAIYTRCELTIQRVETHLLDPTPLSLASIARGTKHQLSTPRDIANLNGSNKGIGASRKFDTKDRSLSSVSDGVAGSTELTNMKQASAAAAAKDGPLLKRMDSLAVTPDTEESKPCSLDETLSSRNIRIAVVGNVDAGKSTLIGALTTSTLDDGRGRCRTSIMKHRHEIETGRTSTAQSHLMGFKSNGEPISGKDSIRTNKRKTEDEVARESYRICTLIDLAGHEKYLKTTIHGVSSGMADYGLILVNSRHPPTHMTQHHLNLCCSFGIPVIIVFTKIDGCPEHAMKNSKVEVHKLLRASDINKRPFAVRNEQDIATCIDKLQQAFACYFGELSTTGLPQPVFREGALITQAPRVDGPSNGLLHKGDVIVGINGKPLMTTRSPNVMESQEAINEFISEIRKTSPGESLRLSIIQAAADGAGASKGPIDIVVKPQVNSDNARSIGVMLSPNYVRTDKIKAESLPDAIVKASKATSDITTSTARSLLTLLGNVFMGKGTGSQSVSGPIGLIKQGSDVVSSAASGRDIAAVVGFAAAISCNLAVVNSLPLPALDGGQLVFVLAEGLTGKKIDQKRQEEINALALSLLLAFSLNTAVGDVGRLIIR